MSVDNARKRLLSYLETMRDDLGKGCLEKITIEEFSKRTYVPKSTLYNSYRDEIEEFKNINREIGSSSIRALLLASRKANRDLRYKNEILTAIAHEYFIENESLKLKLQACKKSNIHRIK